MCMVTKDVGDWKIAIHSRHGPKEFDRKHVHISKRGLKGQYSWNVDGTRHDAHRFPESENCIKRAKDLAASALNIPVGSLELVTAIPGGVTVTIGEAISGGNIVYQMYLRLTRQMTLFGSADGRLVAVVNER